MSRWRAELQQLVRTGVLQSEKHIREIERLEAELQEARQRLASEQDLIREATAALAAIPEGDVEE